VGAAEGLKHDSAVHCNGLVNLSRAALTNYIGRVDSIKQQVLDAALGVALAIEDWLTSLMLRYASAPDCSREIILGRYE
jgi:hypothetical protein